jgi:molecular chaperone GrpE
MSDEQELTDELNDKEGEGAAEGGESPGSDRLSELARELEEVRQHVLYAQAETQNVRRRLEAEKQTASLYAATGFARDMLSVKDNLERALATISDELRADDRLKGLVTGIEATGRELESVFARNGITRIESVGKPLDPNRHQAMKDRLLRPALVGVARNP